VLTSARISAAIREVRLRTALLKELACVGDFSNGRHEYNRWFYRLEVGWDIPTQASYKVDDLTRFAGLQCRTSV
jgi:hypothetical protein